MLRMLDGIGPDCQQHDLGCLLASLQRLRGLRRRSGVKAAKQKLQKPSKFNDADDRQVAMCEDFQVNISRKGRFFDSVRYTPRQLKLRNEVSIDNPGGFNAKGFVVAAPTSELEVEVSCIMSLKKDKLFWSGGPPWMAW